jgi:hypothetical protein
MSTERSCPIEGKMELVTAETAFDLLSRNVRNRKLSKHMVNRYKSDILAGRWKTNGEGIIVDWNGDLLDGQHRLHAIFEAGVPVRCLVVRGVDPDAFSSINSGRARNAAGAVSAAGYSNSERMASIATWLRIYVFKSTGRSIGAAKSTSRHWDVLACIEANPDIASVAVPYANICSRAFRGVPSISVAVSGMLFRRVDEELGIAFMEALLSSSPELCPAVRCIHRRIAGSTPKRFSGADGAAEFMGGMITVWNAWQSGRVLELMRTSVAGPIPQVRGLSPIDLGDQ